MCPTGVLVSICIVLVCLVVVELAPGVVHGAAGNGLLHIPSNESLTLAGCPSHCGDVKISYPFGIGPGCFRQGFELNCDDTAHPPMLFLRNSTTQITSIYAGSNSVYASDVGFNVTMNQGVDTYNNVSWATPEKGILFINEENSLYVVGCDVDVYMFGDNMTDLIGTCMSICSTGEMERANNVYGYCNGIGCCEINLPWGSDLSTFMIKIVRHNTTRAEQDEALSKVKVILSEYYRFVLNDLYSSWVNTSKVNDARFDIAITDQPNCERAQVNKGSYACNNESYCNNLPSGRGYNCLCPNSRQGNPYVVKGCTPAYDPRPKEKCTRWCGNMSIPFPFGIEEGCYANSNFRLNCTTRDVTVLDLRYAQYRVTQVSLHDGSLAVSNMLNDTSSNNMERIVNTNYDGAYQAFEDLLFEPVVDGIFDSHKKMK